MQKVMSFLCFQSCQNLVRKFLVCAHMKTFPNRGKKVKEITADFCLEGLVCLLTFLQSRSQLSYVKTEYLDGEKEKPG